MMNGYIVSNDGCWVVGGGWWIVGWGQGGCGGRFYKLFGWVGSRY